MNAAVSAPELARCESALRIALESEKWDQQIDKKIRSMVGESSAAIIADAVKLQGKARRKFGRGVWWATPRSLQQATPAAVARQKAEWLRADEVFDLCCGIGGDALALTKRGNVTAVDRDPTMVAMASENVRLNLAAEDAGRCRFVRDDLANIEFPKAAVVHIDPDRRDGSNRKTRPEDYSPHWDVVESILSRCNGAVVKIAPTADLPDRSDRHRVWISLAGSVREQSLLVGSAVEFAAVTFDQSLGGKRSAISIKAHLSRSAFVADPVQVSVRRCDRPARYMIDPDAAVRAAQLTEAFADRFGLGLLGGPSGFLTGDDPIRSDLAVCEEVIWSGACDDRKLRKTLRSMNRYPRRVKTRGVTQDANDLERRYRECGEEPITLWIGKGPRRQYAVMTREVAL